MKIKCMLGKTEIPCKTKDGGMNTCSGCGWWPEELERRKKLPLVKGEDGLRRKYVGEASEFDGNA